MKRVFLLLLGLAIAGSLLVSCAQSTGPDLSGLMEIRDDLDAEDWNEGHDDFYNDQWYSFAYCWSQDPASFWTSDEDATANFAVVSWVDEDSAEYAARPQFLRAEQGYGYSKFGWRIYGTDPESGIDNGFAGVDQEVVDVSIDIWVPDVSYLTLNCWLHVAVVGTTALGTWTYSFADPDDLCVIYDNDPLTTDPITGKASGSGGWVTLTKQVTIDANGIVDVHIKMANQNPDDTYVAYFDNLEVTYVSGP